MQIIIAPITPDDISAEVVNLQDALLALLKSNVVQALEAPNSPTQEELDRLTAILLEEREQSTFGEATRRIVFYFQVQQSLGDNLLGVVEETTAPRLNQRLKELGLLDILEPASFIVRGIVRGVDGNPLAGLIVRARDRDLPSLQRNELLGEAVSDEAGFYRIEYTADNFSRVEKDTADLQVRVYPPNSPIDDNTPPLAESETRFNAKPDETIDLVVSANQYRGPSEFERRLAVVTPLVERLPIADLTAADIEFLSGETGEDSKQIALLVQSHRLATGTGIPAAVFYGWFCLNLPSEPAALWATPTDTLLLTLRTAIAQNIVPASIDVDLVSAAIEQIKLDRVLQAPALGTAASLGDLLATLPVRLELGQQRAIAAVVTELRPDDPQLVERIAEIPGFGSGDDVAVGVARTLRLGALTRGHIALAQELQLRLQHAGEREGTLRPLAKLRPDEWIDLAYTYDPPDGRAITRVAYAEALAAGIERQHPNAALAAHLTDGRRLARQPVLTDVSEFLSNHPDFDIVTANLNVLSEPGELGGIAQPKHVVDGLRALQRMRALDASWEETATLLENDLQSPHQLLAAGPGQLTALLDGQLALERVTALYRQAEELHSTTFAAITAAFSPFSAPQILPDDVRPGGVTPSTDPDNHGGANPLGNLPPLAQRKIDPKKFLTPREPGSIGQPGPIEVGPVFPVGPDLTLTPHARRAIADQPTLRALFGDQDACACEHCNSVLSPAAYFVDVLQFIKDANLLEPLLKRRPDLQDLELSCNNTNTVVPAIDLALDILENEVAFPLPVVLEDGTELAAQLIDGQIVGTAVKKALASTVRNLAGELRATQEGDAWTVVDGHRRWKLIAQNEALKAGTLSLDTAGLDLPALTAALDQNQVGSGAEFVFERLFVHNHGQPLDLTNYVFTITPLPTGRSWRVEYQFVAQLVTDHVSRLVLQTPLPAGVVWWGDDRGYNQAVIEAIQNDLSNGIVHELVYGPLASRFYKATTFTVTPVDADTWTITSAKRELTLHLAPAALTITSLTYQSGDPDADAIAEPENHNPAAYAQLKDAKFPWSLPVDLPLEEVRLFLERARSSRQRLIELMLPVDQLPRNDASLALEVLGLSEAEANLIAQPPPSLDPDIYAHGVYANWGISSDIDVLVLNEAGMWVYVKIAPLDYLKNVSILLQRSRLSFEELQAVLATRFVSPDDTTPLHIEPGGSCKPSEMTVVALTTAHLDRIHRFVRLQRRLGWSTLELDTAIKITTGTDLNIETLLKLASLVRLHDLLDLSMPVILAWWSEPVAVATRMSQLARALELTPSELVHARALLKVDNPFAIDNRSFAIPGDTFGFCERVIEFRNSDIAFEDLRYLLQHVKTPGSNVDLDERQLTDLAGTARDAVRSILDAPEETLPVAPADPESAEARLARENEAIRVAKENAAVALATRIVREDAAIEALATGLGAARELVDDLLRTRLRQPSDTTKRAIDAFLDSSFITSNVSQPIHAAVKSVLVRLHKAVFVCDALKLSRTDLRLMRPTLPLRLPETDANGFTTLDFNTLPVPLDTVPASVSTPANPDHFEQLRALEQLSRLAQGAGGDLLHRYAAINFDAPSSADAVYTILATGLGLEEPEVKAAANQLHITTGEYRDPIALTRLIELLIALKQLGATVPQAIGLTASSPSDAAAIDARELLRGKFGEAQWHDLVKPIADTLRERQRTALVDYLVARDGLRGADDLYERYLIDVQTGSCLKTTRLLQATAAVQLFVQRVILNLERGLSLTSDKRAYWEWMQNYRVWEANRKVFLFPENWLLPELRDDKTAIFRQMESALTEQEPSLESTRAALLTYLEELGDLAQISVIAMYEDQQNLDTTPPTVKRTLYVVGRTPNEPYRYFWRSCTEFGSDKMSWSGWEALDLDNANDFIMPFVFEGDLHVAWPIFRKTTEGEDKTRLLWEVQIAWTRKTPQGWVKRKLGHETLSVQRLLAITELRSFVFKVRKSESAISTASKLLQERITIDCYVAEEKVEILEHKPNLVNKTSGLKHTFVEDPGWNVWLLVNGYVWEHYKLEGHDVYRPVHDMTLTLEFVHRYQQFQSAYPPEYAQATYKGNGHYEIAERLVANGADFTVTFTRSGETLHEMRGKTTTDNNRTYQYWTCDRTVILEIAVPSDTVYYPARAVKFAKASGSFMLTSGRDMEVLNPSDADKLPELDTLKDIQYLGNQFIWTNGGHVVKLAGDGDLSVDPDFGPRMQITSATVATMSASNTPEIWHLQDAAIRYYVRRKVYGWEVYPDGQDFVGVYRSIAAASTSKLFDPSIQGMRRDSQQTLLPAPPSPPYSTTSPMIRFDRRMPYAHYNWELFLHAPLAIADHLASQQRFEDARRWLHAVFDPTIEKEDKYETPQFWRFLPFHNDAQPDSIAQMLTWLADPKTTDPKVMDFETHFAEQIEEWKQNPFMPHLVARLRPSAYQWHTFFAYLEVLIGWGDQLFRRDTRESVNEATLLYVLAAKLLGARPRVIPALAPPPAQTYRSLPKDKFGNLDGFRNAWVSYFDLPGVRKLTSQTAQRARSSQAQGMTGLVNGTAITIEKTPPKTPVQILTSLSALAFCIPQNEKVTEFYDRIENRLFNARNCRNIEGVFRDLPLYEPPIDPLLLIRARAAGLDISSAIAELYAPLPNYRFSFTLQKALELCAELKSLGSALLTALEKKDAEELTLLRSSHEIAMLKLVLDTRKQQVAEAEANITALQQSEVTIFERFGQYQKLLGKPSISKGQDGLPVVEQSSSLSVATDPVGGASGMALSHLEVNQLMLTAVAHHFTQAANSGHVVAGVLSLIPNFTAGTPFASSNFGGSFLGSAASAIAKSIEMVAAEANYIANQLGTFAGYERRQDEWVHQSKLALAEMKAIQKQILAAHIRKSIAEHELSNHETQSENAKEVDAFMRSKFTNKQLYGWMSSQIAEVFFRTYQLALDQARRAERAYKHELGLDDKATPFVKSSNWNNLKEGLLAGEHLHHDLKRMESAYLERNVREYEITKHVSVMQLAPVSLLQLKETGQCEVSLPEALFDLDFPGHYLRRIKSVSLTIPCVSGPYSSVPCTLTLLKSEIRKNNVNSGDYERDRENGNDDSRFTDLFGSVQSIVTSSAQNDSGLFETNLRDERYLPFEGSGVISDWNLALPAEVRQFDYDTISDVILHIRYTAREGGGSLRNSAVANLKTQIEEARSTGSVRLFSIRHEFPTEWAKFTSVKIEGAINTAELTLKLLPEHYPFWSQGRLETVKRADVIAKTDNTSIGITERADGTGKMDLLQDRSLRGLLMGTLDNFAPSSPVSPADNPLKLLFNDNTMEDLWLALTWGK